MFSTGGNRAAYRAESNDFAAFRTFGSRSPVRSTPK
jgi:hypothetical protein